MGFGSVYRSLTEIFPQIDSRILRAVAIEHPKDADEAAAVVLSEILPSLPSNLSHSFTQSWNKSSGRISEGEVERGLEDVVSRCRSFLVASSSKSSASSSSETIPLVVRGQNTSTDLVSDMNKQTNFPSNVGLDVCHKDSETEEVLSLRKARGKEHESNDGFGRCFDVQSEAELGLNEPKWYLQSPEDDIAKVVSAVAQENVKSTSNFWQDLGFHMTWNQAESNTAIVSENAVQKVVELTPGDNTTNIQQGSCPELGSGSRHVVDEASKQSLAIETTIGSENAVQKVVELTPGDNTTNIQQGSCSELGSGSIHVVDEASKQSLASENGDTELGGAFSTSTHGCSVDHLEEIIEDARSNKKTLLTVMESVMNLMREVELQEKDAEKAKEEAARGGLDTLQKVVELKEMLEHAKEANDMHAGEVYGERSILATEVKELENRLLSLSEERNKSLAALDEMRETLEIRLAAALEMKTTAELERKEKEDSALKVLTEQEAIMEKVVQESKLLQEEAEENSKLREFLMDRGQIVDSLQGEISVICQDVKLLKERFENRVSLTKSISSSHTSSCGSSMRSLVLENPSEPLNGVPETSSNNKISEAAAFFMNKEKDDHRELLEDGWDIFD